MKVNSYLKEYFGKICTVFVIMFFVMQPMFVHAAYKIESIDVANVVNKDFVVGPGKIEIELNPGESKTAAIMVSNRTGDTKTFTLQVEDFTGSKNPDESVVLLGNERGPYSLKDFLHFESKTFELKNGERAVVPVTVTLPVDVEPGGRYGSVLVSTTATKTAASQSSAIVSRLGVLFFIKTPGDVMEDGHVSSFNTANNKKLFGSGPINFKLLYENNGSVHLNPYGEIRIKNMVGEEVGGIEVDPWFAMPQSVRTREVSWNRSFLFGRYTASASINRGYGDIIDTNEFSFWVIPWKIAATVAVVIFLIVFFLRLIIGRFEIKRKA